MVIQLTEEINKIKQSIRLEHKYTSLDTMHNAWNQTEKHVHFSEWNVNKQTMSTSQLTPKYI